MPVAGIVDSDFYGNSEIRNGLPVIGGEDTFDFEAARDQYDFFIGTPWSSLDPRSKPKRLAYIDLIDRYQLNCATLIHPNSTRRVRLPAVLGQQPNCSIPFEVANVKFELR